MAAAVHVARTTGGSRGAAGRRRIVARAQIRRVLGVVLALTVGVTLLAWSAPANAATEATFRAEAYGTYAFVGDVVVLRKTGRSAMGCTPVIPHHTDNATAGVNVPGLLSLAAIHSFNDTFHVPGGSAGRSTAETTGLNLLDGSVTASLVKAVAQTTWDGVRFRNSANGTSFVNLVIGGNPIDATPPANTRITLPGIGYVLMNEQVSVRSSQKASMQTNGLRVVVTVLDNAFGLEEGTQIIVSHAEVISKDVTGPLTGNAYSSQVTLGNEIESEPTAIVWVQCVGTNGQLLTNQVAGISVPTLLQAGTATNTARGWTSPFPKGTTTSTVQGVNLLNGLVTATAVKAVASVAKPGLTPTFSTEGTRFLDLHVTGFPEITDAVAPNTSIDIPGIGTLWLRRVVQTGNVREVRMIELVVSDPNAASARQQYGAQGVEPGLVIQVAVARMGLRPQV